MYVCICKAVTDGQIKEAIRQGICTRRELIHCFSIGRDCGKCNRDIRALLEAHAPNAGDSAECGCSDLAVAEFVLQKNAVSSAACHKL
jgi:bacterioferritin-associated ferredoxin